MPNLVRVFISYSHDSEAHKQQVLEFAKKLLADGIDVELDAWVNGSPEQGWPNWMLDRIEQADFVLVVCTKTYYQRARNKAPKGEGKGVKWEALIGANLVYHNDSLNKKMVPVFIADADVNTIPEWLAGWSYYGVNDEVQYQKLLRYLINRPEHIKPDLGEYIPNNLKSYKLLAGLLVLALFVLLSSVNFSEQSLISGVVLDEDNQIIANATITYWQDGKMWQTTSDALGYFEFAADSDTPAHMRHIRVVKQGFEQSQLDYYFDSNQLQVQLIKVAL